MGPSSLTAERAPTFWRRRVRWKAIGRAAAYAIGFAVPVTALAFIVRSKAGWVLTMDETAIRWATGITRDNPGLRDALIVLQEVMQPWRLYIVATGVCVLVWWRLGYRSRALWAFATMMVAWNLALDVKLLVQRARPVLEEPVSHAPGYSFPSGHAANSAAACTVLVLLLWPAIKGTRWQYVVPGALGLLVLATAADRVFLGVHYPSDVIAGVLLGCGIAVASFVGYRGWSPDRPTTPPKE